MSQNDFTIANQGFPAFRADLNSALQALASNSSGTSAPSTTFANMWWYDSANNIMYIRNEDNDAWIKFAELDQTNDKFVLSGTLQLDDGTVSAPALTFNSDTNMGIYRGGTDILKFVTAGVDAITIDASQNVGIGETAPLGTLHVRTSDASITSVNANSDDLIIENNGNCGISIASSTTGEGMICFIDSGDTNIGRIQYQHSTNEMNFRVNDAERMRITSAGNVGIGTSSPDTNLDVEGAGDCTISITANSTSHDSKIDFVQGSSIEGGITYDHNGSYASEKMAFRAGNNGTHMYLTGDGNLLVGTTNNTPAQSNIAGALAYRPAGQLEVNGNNTTAVSFGRTDDGRVIDIYSAGTREGSIDVSGTTVSLAGAHLSRWSRLVGGGQPNTILRGTVMSNLDSMLEWADEDNEQLNHTKVSDVEGDVNVAGVFQSWDIEDDFDDYYLAMTGDFVIRIAQGTTVARGDLLMSAGDGTAKPQDDDIVRSKTIAKVTSTNVSHTYDDGTYLVPCVLMAC